MYRLSIIYIDAVKKRLQKPSRITFELINMYVLIPFARSTSTNKVVGVDEVQSGLACECVCLYCNTPLVANKGGRRRITSLIRRNPPMKIKPVQSVMRDQCFG